ncbi:hypothetical protein BKA66DRAFT_73110 [Pyrenochaeta sp. MPI-SDFR-AT-0127]|nr:hypothetical protein BKA66DRAFT_73110 [Pyrenochaeta sp. MPI-SDFR-AT-0127]
MDAFDLHQKASPNEARIYAKHTEAQWARFYEITKKIVHDLQSENADLKWLSVEWSNREEIRNKVNAELTKDNIPEVNYSLFKWRMTRALKPRTKSKGKETPESKPATSGSS